MSASIPRPLISSVSIERQGAHDVLRIWSRGGLAGELVVDRGDGEKIRGRLLPIPLDAEVRTDDRGEVLCLVYYAGARAQQLNSPEDIGAAGKTHKQRHASLHNMLDELIADWIRISGRRPSEATILELMQWSHSQTIAPTEPSR